MSVTEEIMALERKLRDAELGPDAAFFADVLHDDVVLDGQRGLKARVVEAHRPGGPAKFTAVEMTDHEVVEHGDAAVVTCKGRFAGPKGDFTMAFMRVWHKQAGRWRVIAATTAKV